MQVVYEDNHIIIVSKEAGEIVQGDSTGDRTLADDVKAYIKERYAKPGAVFLGTVHRLDRPAQGLVIFARTSKALSRLNEMLRRGGMIQKTYWAVTAGRPVCDTGCSNLTRLASKLMLPSGLLRGAPYLRSPFMGQPIAASWQRI